MTLTLLFVVVQVKYALSKAHSMPSFLVTHLNGVLDNSFFAVNAFILELFKNEALKKLNIFINVNRNHKVADTN
jgi:hypothetical protein